MAKSQIIKDIANGNVSLEISLKRALVIAHDLKNKKLIDWINNELYGYEVSADIPEYRKLLGNLKISYVAGFTKISNQSISSGILPDGYEDFSFYKCRDGISTIEDLIKSKNTPTVSLSELIPFLKKNSDSISILNFYMEIPNSAFSRIIDNVSKEIMNILLEIDDEIGNLDNLDISVVKEKQQSINKVINVHIDSFVNVGDGNKISNSEIIGKDKK